MGEVQLLVRGAIRYYLEQHLDKRHAQYWHDLIYPAVEINRYLCDSEGDRLKPKQHNDKLICFLDDVGIPNDVYHSIVFSDEVCVAPGQFRVTGYCYRHFTDKEYEDLEADGLIAHHEETCEEDSCDVDSDDDSSGEESLPKDSSGEKPTTATDQTEKKTYQLTVFYLTQKGMKYPRARQEYDLGPYGYSLFLCDAEVEEVCDRVIHLNIKIDVTASC